MPSWTIEAVADEMARRRLATTPLLQRMMDVRDRYNADVVTPVPEVDDDIPLKSLAPMLIADAVDHTALYAAQVMPGITVPSVEAGKPTGVRSIDYARRRRQAIEHVWDESWIELVLGRMYRHLAGYASSALVVELDFEKRLPLLRTRDPLASYPEPKAPEDLSLPSNVGFIWGRSLDWLHRYFPETKERIPRGSGFATSSSEEGEMWDVVEWMDYEQVMIGVLGPRDTYRTWASEPLRWAMELRSYPNPIGRCPAVVPRRVTMDKIISQLSNLTGHTDLMAKLVYMDIRATERSIFPERFILAKTGQNPRLLDGTWHDGAGGEMNIIVDADQVGNLPATPDPYARQAQDRIERNMRVSSGLVPQAGGETYGAMRTGRAIDSLMGAALDPRTAELHHIGERYLAQANEIALGFMKARWPSRAYAVGWDGGTEFVPSTHVETVDGAPFVRNKVQYPIPGVDDANATQIIGQLLGARLLDNETGMRMHPLIKDPDGVKRRLNIQSMEEVMIQSFLQRASTGGVTPVDGARVLELLNEGEPLYKAVMQADKEASERQATQAPEPQPGMAAAPEAMPGLAMPGEGAEMQAPPAVPPPEEGLKNVKALVAAMQAPGGS